MNNILGRLAGGRFYKRVGLAVGVLLLAQVLAEAASTAFSRAFVLGDSLSDTGNFHALSGGTPPPPYFNGRFSNGRLWIEYLAEDLGMEILPGDNYAVAGATTGHLNANNQPDASFPGVQHQLASLRADYPNGLDSGALYVVWAGANDFFVALATGGSPQEMIANGVGNTFSTVLQLWTAGARHILVVNLPDLGLTPLAGANAPGITFLSAAYNQALAGALAALGQSGIPTIQVDAFSTLRAMVNNPSDYGFTNVTSPFLFTGGDPSTFLFWDFVHPTTGGHRVLADAAADSLIDRYLPGRGNGSPDARINALKGLLQAQ